MAEVPPAIIHPLQPATVSVDLLHLLDAAERAPRREARLHGRRAPPHVLRPKSLEMRLHFFVEPLVQLTSNEQRANPRPEDADHD
jgi:hypothetical protein